MMNTEARMRELILRLDRASEAYYGGKGEILSNFEWDAMFDELRRLEAETGIVLPDFPKTGRARGLGRNQPQGLFLHRAACYNSGKGIATVGKNTFCVCLLVAF